MLFCLYLFIIALFFSCFAYVNNNNRQVCALSHHITHTHTHTYTHLYYKITKTLFFFSVDPTHCSSTCILLCAQTSCSFVQPCDFPFRCNPFFRLFSHPTLFLPWGYKEKMGGERRRRRREGDSFSKTNKKKRQKERTI